MSRIVTAKEVGEFLKLTGTTIYKLALTGQIPGFKVGNSWRFDMDEIIKHLKQRGKGDNPLGSEGF